MTSVAGSKCPHDESLYGRCTACGTTWDQQRRDRIRRERGELRPRDCEICDCQQYVWNGAPCMLQTDPRETCRCTHPTSRHRFRYDNDV